VSMLLDVQKQLTASLRAVPARNGRVLAGPTVPAPKARGCHANADAHAAVGPSGTQGWSHA